MMHIMDSKHVTHKRKYKNKTIEYKGITFDSKFEYRKYLELEILEKSGYIRNLERIEKGILLQAGKTVMKNGRKSKQRDITYKPDFHFYVAEEFVYLGVALFEHEYVSIEIKGQATSKTADYSIRKRMMINALTEDEVFIEVIKGKSISVNYWRCK